MRKTYIIIITYNAKLWLDKCLGSIDFNQHQVVVVDNHSTDGTLDEIETNFPQVKLFIQEKNLGFGQANNLGISYALKEGADHVFLLNQDAYLVGNVLERLVELQKENKPFGILSPIHVNADKTKLDRNFSNYVRYDKTPYFYSDHVLSNSLKDIYEVPFVNAAGWLISKSCLMTVGGFDPLFFHYGEDDNYCQRLIYHGFKIGVVPNSFLIHDREDRQKTQIQLFSNEYYIRELRNFKVKYANINLYNKSDILNYKKKMKMQLIKAFIKRDKKKIKNLKAYLDLVNQTLPKVEESILLNRKKQPNYLDLD
jgi:GT2 family glycosyltransferase